LPIDAALLLIAGLMPGLGFRAEQLDIAEAPGDVRVIFMHLDSGRFEVIALPHTAKWRVLGVAFRAATRGLGPQPTVEHYLFTTLKPIPLQLDGELLALDPATPVRIDIAPAALATLG
jgi:hypothetical protein